MDFPSAAEFVAGTAAGVFVTDPSERHASAELHHDEEPSIDGRRIRDRKAVFSDLHLKGYAIYQAHPACRHL
jgi:hypothetical protein